MSFYYTEKLKEKVVKTEGKGIKKKILKISMLFIIF